MLRYFHHRKGKARTGAGIRFPELKKGEFLWIFMANPSVKEVVAVSRKYSLQPKIFTKYKKENHSARYRLKPLEAVILDYYVVGDKIKTSPQLIILMKDVLITCTPTLEYYEKLFDRICENFGKYENEHKKLGYLFHNFLVEDTNDNYDVLELIEKKIEEIDERIVKNRGNIDIKLIIDLKRKLFMIGRRLWSSSKVIFMLKKGITPLEISAEELNLFDDVYDTFIHQIEMVETQRGMLSDSLTVYETVINNNLATISNSLSNVMKKLTAITLILMIPTLIASIYGMNFKFMPEIGWRYGYILAIGLMAFSVIMTVLYARKKEWI
ncbi:MAG: CorA family divalent cation transporter [Candidatus Woesearchaeota archaeon]